MTSVLFFSMKSPHCVELLKFINEHEPLKAMIKLHDVNVSGVPNGITRVPSLLNDEGKVIIGGDIRTLLESLIVTDFEAIDSSSFTPLDGGEAPGKWFGIDQFGQTLQPKMTKALEDKISMKVEDAYHNLKIS